MQFRRRHFMRQHAIVEIPSFLRSHRRQASGNCMRNCQAIAAPAAGVEGTGGSGGRKRAWLRCPWAAAGPGRASRRRITAQHCRRRRCGGRRRVRRARASHAQRQAPPDWRPPRGLRGLAGLRGAAPNEVRSPSLAGGQATRRPEIWRGHKHRRTEKPQNSS